MHISYGNVPLKNSGARGPAGVRGASTAAEYPIPPYSGLEVGTHPRSLPHSILTNASSGSGVAALSLNGAKPFPIGGKSPFPFPVLFALSRIPDNGEE